MSPLFVAALELAASSSGVSFRSGVTAAGGAADGAMPKRGRNVAFAAGDTQRVKLAVKHQAKKALDSYLPSEEMTEHMSPSKE